MPRTCPRRSTRWATRRCPRPVSSTTAGHSNRRSRDLMEWVEDGTAPPAETGYTLDADQRLTLAPSAAERGGVQPVVRAAAERRRARRRRRRASRSRSAVEADAPRRRHDHRRRVGLRRHRRVPVPPMASTGHSASVRLETTHVFDTPGTYFPSVRVTAHRDGDVDAADCRLLNLGRVRVVVS